MSAVRIRMGSSPPVYRVTFGAWITAGVCVRSRALIFFQRYRSVHGLGGLLIMDARKGKQAGRSGVNRRSTVQTWRAMSSHSHHAGISNDNLAGAYTSRKEVCVNEDLKPTEKHSVSMEVGWSLMRFIKGKGGVTQEEIELENGVKLLFPVPKNDVLIIEGTSVESVSNACEKVQIIINKAVNSRDFDYSHFVSLPLAVHPGLVSRLFAFQNEILGITNSRKDDDLVGDNSAKEDERLNRVESSRNSDVKAATKGALIEPEAGGADSHFEAPLTSDIHPVSYPPKASKSTSKEVSSSRLGENLGIDKSIFIKPSTFHLTILMLKLWNKDRVQAAANVLQSVSSKVLEALGNRPISIRLKGLECMKGSLAKARVLYAPVEEIGGERRLLDACQIIIDAYVEAGLVMENDMQNKLKLHATLMNVRHRKRQMGRRNFDYFDARGIFQLYGSEEWGEYPIREAHLSERFNFDDNGYYHCCGSIPFPQDMEMV